LEGRLNFVWIKNIIVGMKPSHLEVRTVESESRHYDGLTTISETLDTSNTVP